MEANFARQAGDTGPVESGRVSLGARSVAVYCGMPRRNALERETAFCASRGRARFTSEFCASERVANRYGPEAPETGRLSSDVDTPLSMLQHASILPRFSSGFVSRSRASRGAARTHRSSTRNSILFERLLGNRSSKHRESRPASNHCSRTFGTRLDSLWIVLPDHQSL